MSTPPDDGPWVVRCKAHAAGARWVVVATVATHREAVALLGCRPRCDWSLSNRPDPNPKEKTPCRS